MKSKSQLIIIVLGVLSLCLGVWQMMQTATMILSPWFLILFYSFITICVSFVLGYLLKKILKSTWYNVTFASMFIMLACITFYVTQYKSTYEIVVPNNYTGEVKLFLSNEDGNDFIINQYGIGYIDENTFKDGFNPKVIKKNVDITKQIKQYNRGAFATTQKSKYSYEYLSFSVSGKVEDIDERDISELIKIKAVDTNRLYRKH
ncbi:hypothetical protein OC25_16670 [Pedobacter kyungheensis]|uniref:Uncharacterized protein n=1 Tax=Pedobacter kyungheensis TaxID=1069985 RepID=A0A0C1DEE3_9SPHI|nr:hypothetical protein [Pedobacter kyungheensis]KIA92320.1 hypothetical protein OC25_16670 [Pedobacter kyungheensis]